MSEYLEMQKGIKEMLENNLKNNRLSHAYIFYGEDGVGKSEMAHYLTALMYAEDGVVDYNNPTTKSIYENTFPNLKEIFPRRMEIVKEDIQDLLKEFSKTSLVPGPRVFIIHEADKLNTKTSNMLLKFIEEPEGEDVHGIFITTDVSNVLPTIISRCNLIGFKSMDKNVLYDRIIAAGVLDKDADIIKELTNNADDAVGMVDKDTYQDAKEMALAFFSVEKEVSLLKIAHDNMMGYQRGGDTLALMLQIMHLFLEEMMYDDYMKLKSYKKEINAFKKNHDKNDIREKLEMVLRYIKMIPAYVGQKNIILDLIACWYR